MEKIKEIKKKTNKYEILLNSEEKLYANDEIMVKHKLKDDLEITLEELELIKEEWDYISCKDTALKYIRNRMHSEKEIQEYLRGKKYSYNIVEKVIAFMVEYKFIDDYKFAEDKGKLFKTYKYQSVIYGLLIKENYNIDVRKGFICYTRSNNSVREITFREKDFTEAIKTINEILDIIQKGFYPKKTKSLMKCIDCTYRNICV